MPCAHATCLTVSPLTHALQHVVCSCHTLPPSLYRSCGCPSLSCAHATSCHMHRTIAAHVGGPTRCVLVPRASHLCRSCVCSGTPCAHACGPACHVLVPHAPYLQRSGGALACRVHMPCVSYPHRSSMCSATPCAVATCFHHLFSARARGPACRVLMARASYPPRSCVCSKTPCAHVTCIMSSPLAHALHHAVLSYLAHATVHRAECPRHGRRLLAAHVCSRHVHHTLAAHAYACTPSCGVLMPCTSYLHRPGVCVNMPCACAACIMSSPLTHALQPAVRSCHVRRLCSAHVCDPARRVLVPRASCLHCSCVWPHTPCAHATCLVPHRSHMRSTMPCAVSMRFRNLVTAHVCDPTCLAPPLMHMLHHAVCPCRVPRTFAASARVPSSRALVPHASCPRRAARRTMPPPRRFTARGAWCV